MGFETMLKTDVKSDINKMEYKKVFKERPHISKSKVDMYSNAVYVGIGGSKKLYYSSEIDTRYIAAKDITFDMLVSLYDINNRILLASRIYKYAFDVEKKMTAMIASIKGKKTNLEARIIGFQNNEDVYLIGEELADFFMKNRIELVEVDLFGSNIRHVAIDAKLGSTFNMLLENRLYRPGELSNSMTVENFEAGLKVADSSKLQKS